MQNQTLPPTAEHRTPQKPSNAASSHMLWFFLLPCLVFLGWASYRLSKAMVQPAPARGLFERLEDIKTAKSPGDRWQAAYELAQKLSAPDALKNMPAEDERRLFKELASLMELHSADTRLRRYVIMTLSRLGRPQALEVLEKNLEEKDDELRFFAAWGFADILLKNPSQISIERISSAKKWCHTSDLSLKKLCASFLVQQQQDPSAISEVEELLKDASLEVKWNAAIALSKLNSASGKKVLGEIFQLETLRSAEFRSAKDLYQLLGSAAQAAKETQDAALLEKMKTLEAAVKPDTPEGRAVLAALKTAQ